MPVSISLGLWMTLITYLISIPLGIRKAVQDGSEFDVWTSTVIIIGYAMPGFSSPCFSSCCSPAARYSNGFRCADSPPTI